MEIFPQNFSAKIVRFLFFFEIFLFLGSFLLPGIGEKNNNKKRLANRPYFVGRPACKTGFFFFLFFFCGLNPSSPKGGVVPTPPNGFRPGAQNRTAKG